MRTLKLLPLLALLPILAACEINTHSEADPDIYSTEFNFRVADATINGPVASVQYDVPVLDSRVVDLGLIMCYFYEQGTWTAMPYTYGVDNPQAQALDYLVTLGFAFRTRTLEIFYEASTANAPLRTQPDRRVKLVIVGPNVAGHYSKQGLDWTDYEAVRKALRLKD